MTTATATVSRLGQLLLVRLLTAGKRGLGPKQLRQDLERLLPQPLSPPQWQTLVEEVVNAGLAETRPLRLTGAGRAQALAVLQIDALPPRANWNTIRQRYLVPLALGVGDQPGEVRKRVATADGLRAYLLKKHFDLPTGATPTLHQALEALACKTITAKLGLPPETTLARLRQAVLSNLLPSAGRLSDKELQAQLPAFVVGARQADAAALGHAILARWLHDGALGQQEIPPAEEPRSADFDLATFANTVLAAARHCPTGWFGDNKVFVSHVWRQLHEEPGVPPLDLPAFKQRLVEANQAGLLTLSRADLVQVMDPADVRDSEIQYLNATFHFLLVERNRP